MFTPYRNVLKTQAVTLMVALLFAMPAFAAAPKKKTFDDSNIGKLETIRAAKGDTFMNLAPRHNVGYTQLVAANPNIDPWLPGEGTEIVLPKWHLLPDTAHEGMVLNTGELLLYFYPADGSAPKTFPIGIGREGLSTPAGETTITRKAAAPTWRPTPRMRQENPELPAVVPAGPENPLGAYALYLGWPSYLIHGTNNERGIGRRASSGCIRMYRDDITWLYKYVTPGIKVTSVNEPVKMGWIKGELYMEAEPNDLQIDELEYRNRQITVDIPDGVIERVRKKAGNEAHRVNWEKVRNALVMRTGIPMQITEKPQAPVVRAKPKAAPQPVKPVRRNDWDTLN